MDKTRLFREHQDEAVEGPQKFRFPEGQVTLKGCAKNLMPFS